MDGARRPPLTRVDDPGRAAPAPGFVPVRRRRPSGQGRYPSPLRHRSVQVWAALVAAAILWLLLAPTGPVQWVNRAVTDALTGPDTAWADTLARAAEMLGTTATYRILWIPTVLVLIWFARWRHLLVYLTTLTVVAVMAQGLVGDASLPRALRSTLTGSGRGYVLPSWPVTVFATVATATTYLLLPRGRTRRLTLWCVAGLVLVLALSRVHLGRDDLSGDLASAMVGAGVAVIAIVALAPEIDFPVVYRRQNRAHLRLDDERRKGISDAVADQLGVAITEVRPYRLAGSAGSTPCRLLVANGPAPYLFGKLYATSHVRSDRRQKFARLLRYGRLEDEGPSPPSVDWSSTRTTCSGSSVTRGCGFPVRTGGGGGARPGVPAGHPAGAQCTGASRRRSRRPAHRRRAWTGPADVGGRRRAPGCQAIEHSGPRRTRLPDRPRLRRAPALDLAAGGRPGQHDADPRTARRLPPGVRPGCPDLRSARGRGSLRRLRLGHHPPAAAPAPGPLRNGPAR